MPVANRVNIFVMIVCIHFCDGVSMLTAVGSRAKLQDRVREALQIVNHKSQITNPE